MKQLFIAGIALLFASGCGAFELSDESSVVNGSWSSTVAAVSGACCQLEMTIRNRDGRLSGTGTVETPGRRVGTSDVYEIAFSGSMRNDRVDLTLDSALNEGSIVGTVERGYNATYDMVLKVDFDGFGYQGKDIILFPRSQ